MGIMRSQLSGVFCEERCFSLDRGGDQKIDFTSAAFACEILEQCEQIQQPSSY